MKTNIITNITAAIIAAILAWSCSSNSTPSPLIAQSERLNGELGELAEYSADFLNSITSNYADKTLGIDIAFADGALDINKVNDALVQFVAAQYMKAHTGVNLDEILNTLGKEEGKITITLSCDGVEKKFDISSKRAKELVRLKPSEINFSAAKESLIDVMTAKAAQWLPTADKQQAKVSAPVDFAINAGFAQYTFTFDNVRAYQAVSQPQLTGRFLPVVKEVYVKLGECAPIVEELLKSFGIEGYRFVFANKKDDKIIRAVIPWSMI